MLGALAGVSAGLGILDSFTGYSAKKQAELDWKQWKKQFDYAAEYNSPINQRQRMVDANFNPSLMLGGNLTNTYSPSPQMGKAQVTRPTDAMIPAITAYQSLSNAKAQEDLTRAEIQLKEQEFRQREETNPTNSDLLKSRLIGQQYRNEYQRIVNSNQQDVYELQKAGLDLKNRQTEKFIGQMDERFRVDIAKDLAQIRNIHKDTQLKETQRGGIESQNVLRKAQTSLATSQDAKNRMDIAVQDLERRARQQGTSYSDNPVMRSIIEKAKQFRDAIWNSSTENQEQSEKELRLIQWILDPTQKRE